MYVYFSEYHENKTYFYLFASRANQNHILTFHLSYKPNLHLTFRLSCKQNLRLTLWLTFKPKSLSRFSTLVQTKPTSHLSTFVQTKTFVSLFASRTIQIYLFDSRTNQTSFWVFCFFFNFVHTKFISFWLSCWLNLCISFYCLAKWQNSVLKKLKCLIYSDSPHWTKSSTNGIIRTSQIQGKRVDMY